jgi:DNA topoisomerase VI subunit B
VTAWALCVMTDVREDVAQRLNDLGGKYRDSIEKVVTRLHQLPCANPHPDVQNMTEGEIMDIFWNEFKAFQNKTEPFHQPARWSTSDVLNGRSHIWHEKYSLPYTKVLGYVACRVTSKLCGIGPAERCWSAVKQVKKDKRSHLSGESTEKRSVIYMSAKQQEAKSLRDKMEKIDASGPKAMFGDDDMNFDLQLEKFGVDTNALRAPATERVFHAWVQDWEKEIRYKNDAVNEARLLQKYKGLVFHDPDTNKTYSIFEENMEYRRGNRNGWFVIAVSSEEGVEDDEPFTLELACDLIGNTQQASGVKVIHAAQVE